MNNFEHLDTYRDDDLIAWLEFKLFGIIELFRGEDPGREEFADKIADYLEKGQEEGSAFDGY